MYGGCGTEYRWFAIKTKVLLPPIPTHILPCAASSEGADWTGVGGGVSSAGLGWIKVKGNSSVTSQLDKIIDTITFAV